MPELWATGQSPFLSSLTYTCLFLIPAPHTAGGFDCKRCCPKAPQASVLPELRTSGSPGHGSLSHDTGLSWGPGDVGQDSVAFEPKKIFKLK